MMPPRSRTAIFCASILSFLALPPNGFHVQGMTENESDAFARAQRSASQYQVKMHSTATTI
jgi:hypothetical protein